MYTISLNVKNNTVLRTGFVKLIDCMPRVIPIEARPLGCDSAVVQAARVSYNTGLKDFDSDKKLIRYLLKNQHTSPFEMVKFKFHIKAPLFVCRQWFRHRMGNFNEVSGRYTLLSDDFYKPIKVSSQNKVNKQMSNNDNLLNNNEIKEKFNCYINHDEQLYQKYQDLINLGVSREIARIGLPQNMYTQFYWSIDLHNLLNFIKLRDSNYAQYEIKEYAKSIRELVKELCPVTLEAFEDYNEGKITFYKYELENRFNNEKEKNEYLDKLNKIK